MDLSPERNPSGRIEIDLVLNLSLRKNYGKK